MKNREIIKMDFEQKQDIKVMIGQWWSSHRENFKNAVADKEDIAGLKVGGVALNLTMASRVILIDLWWNNSVEAQAFGMETPDYESYSVG